MAARAPAGLPSVAYWAGLVGRLAGARRAGRTLLLLSDFDGTLTPIVRDPAEAWLPPPVREDLRTLVAAERIVVGIVSGRSLADLRARIGLSSVIYAGCHGLEMAGRGLAFEHAPAREQSAALAGLAGALARDLAGVAGVQVEAKGLSVAVHYRNADAGAFPAVLRRVQERLGGQPGFVLQPGRKVLEVLPAVDWDKGGSVLWIERQVEDRVGGRVTTLYLGDDAADERAFAALHGRGLTVRVGDATATRAAYRLPGVDDVHRVISALADEVAEEVAR
jgi:trehalose 6-phosphate phosphatase